MVDKIDMKKEYNDGVPIKHTKTTSWSLWHKDGVNDSNGELRVYRNGELADTNGKWEHISIVEKHE